MNEYESLNHTKWECKYHAVFILKYRRKVLYGTLRKHLGSLFRELARQKECEVGEGHLMVDHVHMLLSIPPKYSVSQVMGYIKGKSAIHIARTYGGKRRNFVGQHFWARGYWVSTVGHNEAAVRKYIQDQEKEDQRLDQLGLFGGQSRFERFTISSLRLCRRSLTRERPRHDAEVINLPPNAQEQRREPAGTNSRVESALDGCLPSAPCCG